MTAPEVRSMIRVKTKDAPSSPSVPSGQAIIAGEFVFCSGQIAIDPRTNVMIEGDLAAQVEQVLNNVAALLEASGTSLARCVKATIYLRDLSQIQRFNEVYGQRMPQPYPPRTVVEVSRLARDAQVEIDVVALARSHDA